MGRGELHRAPGSVWNADLDGRTRLPLPPLGIPLAARWGFERALEASQRFVRLAAHAFAHEQPVEQFEERVRQAVFELAAERRPAVLRREIVADRRIPA